MTDIQTKNLIIAVVDKGDALLMRKKPIGSAPYEETWYLFGCERISGQEDSMTMKDYLKKEIGIEVEVDLKSIPSAEETKPDHDGITKHFTYINLLCHYKSGVPLLPKGTEKIEWLPKDKLADYDLVPPSVKLLKGMGYMK